MERIIHVLGVPRHCTPEEERILARADLIIGSPRQMSLVPAPTEVPQMDWSNGLNAVCGAIAECAQPVVLASGDPGFFGIVRKLNQRFPTERLVVHPSPSSVSRAFGLIGQPWTDAVVVSAHGRDIRTAIALARAYPKVAILTEPGNAVDTVFEAVQDLDRSVWVVADIGGPLQEVGRHRPGKEWPDPNVVIVLDEQTLRIENSPETEAPTLAGQMPKARFGQAEQRFDHRDGMVTKAEVRALVLAWLAPGPGQIIWDIGCGSGSVAIEAATTGAAVFAADHDPEQVVRTIRNANIHHVHIRATHASAKDAVATWLPIGVADAAFIGGGGDEALHAVMEAKVGRIVLALAALDRVVQVVNALEDAGYNVIATQLQANRLEPLPNGQRRLRALNPVTVIRAKR